ncbi:serine protease [Sedimentitalea todarodis]|uniref:Serine protease n=1 Tax=Sedimentitalea todarodis TaxID=1631240 RepID=A0ABU3VB48_9RHOB|nr:serine protease [Sedimentitalea todarodis]MDU9003384.1 serine protease [Sedimentitalea todarodis]
MADHFLSKTRVAPEDFVEAGGTPVLERYDALRALLSERAGPEVAALFAEPLISHGNDAAPPTVAWYADTTGEPRALSSLSPAERDRAEAYLSDHLRPLRALADQPESADLALGALSTYGRDDVVMVGDRPMIVNWGLMPDCRGANVSTRPEHFAANLGRYLTLPTTGARVPEAAPVAAPAVAPAAAAAPVVADGPVQRRITRLAWVPLLILLLLAGGFLAWLLMPGSRLFHTDAPPVITEEATLRAARELNDSLRERRTSLASALEGAMCRADGMLVLPDGLTPEGLSPPALGVKPESRASIAPNALLPSSPARVVLPDAADPDAETDLLAVIEARTVLVLAGSGNGRGATGSGFVVGPDLIMTNQHVIAPALADGGQIIVTGGNLEAPQIATVVKSQGPLMQTGGDFALLQIADTGVSAFQVHVPQESLKLSNVVAAGYPGDVMASDINFAALKAGDVDAVPGLTVTEGIVNTEQQIGPETHVLMHSAALSSGNSGGPLVDMCGRLVGVNTFVRAGRLQNRGFALTTADMMAFLQGTNATPAIDSAACAPVVQRAAAGARKAEAE